MEGIVFIIAIAGIFIYLLVIQPQKEKRDKDNYDLFKYVSHKEGLNRDEASPKDIEKVLSKPSVRKEAEERRQEVLRRNSFREDQQHKEKVLQRTYSYKYEDVIYQIFAPYATKNTDSFSKDQKWLVHTSLEFSFVAHEISCILRMPEGKANDLLREFVKNGLVTTDTYPDSPYLYCSMGTLLLYDWDVISKYDKNFSTWIESHPLRETKEHFEERRKEFIRINL